MTTDPAGESRWLDDDAQLQAAAAQRRQDDAAVSDLVPTEWSGVELSERLRGCRGCAVEVRTTDGVGVRGVIDDVGVDWFLVNNDTHATVVARKAVVTLGGLGAGSGADAGERLLSMSVVWRTWSRERRPARWALSDGRVITGSVWRVGRDVLDVVTHPLDRGPALGDARLVLPYSALLWAAAAR